MKREVDQRKTRKALRKLRRAAESATGEGGPGLTDWEKEFVDGVSTRLEKYGSAFRDPGKGRLDEALSNRQTQVTRVIAAKSRKAKAAAKAETAAGDDPTRPAPKPSGLKRNSSFRQKAKPGWKPRVRDINADAVPDPAPDPPPETARVRPALKLIRGGRRG